MTISIDIRAMAGSVCMLLGSFLAFIICFFGFDVLCMGREDCLHF